MVSVTWNDTMLPTGDKGHIFLGGALLMVVDVDRAIDNLSKSGKLLNQPGRRESMPMMGGPESFSNFQRTCAVPYIGIVKLTELSSVAHGRNGRTPPFHRLLGSDATTIWLRIAELLRQSATSTSAQ